MTTSTAALRPGAAHKTATWRAGALIFGWGLLLLLLRILLSAWLSVSGRLFITFLIVGFVLSVPYGWAAVRGRLEQAPDPEPKPIGVVQGVPHAPNSTYIVVSPPPPKGQFRVIELGPVSLFFYTVFWRAPLSLGDQVLSGLWRLLDRLGGQETVTFPTMADIEAAERETTEFRGGDEYGTNEYGTNEYD